MDTMHLFRLQWVMVEKTTKDQNYFCLGKIWDISERYEVVFCLKDHNSFHS